jgi:hypothetical protein
MQTEATHALTAGLQFLKASQQADGSFLSDWYRVAGDEVVDVRPENSFFQTAFIGSVLLGVAGAEAIVRGVTQFAEDRREPGSVWRYLTKEHPGTAAMAPDVDDTALAAMLLREAGRPTDEADAVLLSNRDRKGRFFTWITVLGSWWRSPARVRILIDRRPQLRDVIVGFKADNQRVRDLDAGVNANVVLYLGRRRGTERTINYLIDVARSAEIADRWYQDPFTLWYLISRALHKHGIQAGAVLLEHLGSSRPTSPLQLAEAVCIALDWGGQVPEQWIAGLLASQSPDGSWERIPLYSVKDERWGGEATTTALCVEALARWLGATRQTRRSASSIDSRQPGASSS